MVFDRSEAGIRNTPLFYPKRCLVYVEGPDDEAFWFGVFPSRTEGKSIKFKAVGGDGQIDKRIEILLDKNIPNRDKRFLVARDSNYRKIKKELLKHPKIVETEYHSIENVMLCKCRIARIIRTQARKNDYPENSVEKWLKTYDELVRPLMIADVMNEQRADKVRVMGKTCDKFLDDSTEPFFDCRKIEKHIKKSGFHTKQIQQAGISPRSYKPRHYSRGHFYFSAVWKFIRFEVARLRNRRSARILQHSLFTMAAERCSKCMQKNRKIKRLVEKAKIAVQAA